MVTGLSREVSMVNRDDSKRVGIWIRVSTEDQVRGESPEHHEKRARFYAEAKGWEVVEVYRLDALSGKTVKDYPETKRMQRDVETRRITGLIFSKLARLARNTRELLDFADFFREHEADLVSLAESIDTSTPAGRLFYTMVAAMAQWEREEIADRVAASVPVRAKLGKPLGGQPPFGYHWVEGKLVPNPDEAPVRKLLHELFQEHKRKKTVARLLNERGYRTRNGSMWSDTTVGRLIEDPTAKGLRRANYTKSSDSSKAWERKPEKEWVFHEVPSIVSTELWEECAAVLQGRKGSRAKRPGIEVRHLFAGLTYCECGTKMYVVSNSPKYVCRECRNKIPIEDLEGIFHEQLKHFSFSTAEIAKHLSAYQATIRDKEETLALLEREETRLTGEADKLYALYQADAIDERGFKERYRPLKERLDQIADEHPALQADLDFLKISELSETDVMTSARDLYARWPSLDQREKRDIVEAITERIVVARDGIAISLLYSPTLPPGGSAGTPGDPGGQSQGSPGIHGNRATQSQRRVALLPFVPIRLFARRYPEPTCLGEHLLAVRRQRHLRQQDVADEIGVSAETIGNWEKRLTKPPITLIPAILRFLGSDPRPVPQSLSDRLLFYRESHGLTVKAAAMRLGVDPDTWARWEVTGRVVQQRHRERLAVLVDAPPKLE